MKYINSIRVVNKSLMITTIVLYLTIYFGVLMQIVLGIYQLTIALIILLYRDKLTEVAKKNLSIYWCAVLVFGACFLTNLFDNIGGYGILFLVFIPMIIAFCFSIFLEELKFKQ